MLQLFYIKCSNCYLFYSVECLQSSSNHLDVNFSAVVLPPGGTAIATFTFYPRETVAYRDVITFSINGLSKRDVTITGAGIEMRVTKNCYKHYFFSTVTNYLACFFVLRNFCILSHN